METLENSNYMDRKRQKLKREYVYNPKPMGSKTRKTHVEGHMKDDRYWERRKRNNAAARKSREQRRLKKEMVKERMTLLQKQNDTLKNNVAIEMERSRHLEEILSEVVDQKESDTTLSSGDSTTGGFFE